jgi:tellurite resistance protein
LINRDGITENIRAHEEEYFRKRDRELIENLRRADRAARERLELEQETGIHDPEMLSELAHLGFTPETITLLPLVPVLQVAWAKAGVSTPERRLIINLARSRGIAAGSAADRQLSEWLDTKPSEETFHKATRLIGAMIEAPEHRVDVEAHELIDYCDKIAHASGGIFGIGRVSHEERDVLREIAEGLKHK